MHLLLIAEAFPIHKLAFSLFCTIWYFRLLDTFPVIDMTGPVFVVSCGNISPLNSSFGYCQSFQLVHSLQARLLEILRACIIFWNRSLADPLSFHDFFIRQRFDLAIK
jgi:Transmembrane adaptor Erv26